MQNELEIQGFSFFWPYIVIKGYSNRILIHNANEIDLIYIVDLPLNLAGISHTFITEQYELFIIGNTEE